ncbi:MAG: hypothetical protein JXQ67_00060 [Campylobacterales bacterium]|nr:hypothetical protein [Campylobacterales bacterium]
MDIASEINRLLLENNISMDSNIDFEVNGELHSMSFNTITESYMQASDESQLVFYMALQKSLSAGEKGVENFFEGMGKLLLMAHFSDKLKI